MRYRYQALDKKGDLINGEVDAIDKAEVLSYLEAQGYTPLIIKKSKQIFSSFSFSFFKKKVPSRDIIIFTQSFSSLIKAGISIDKALNITKEVLESSPLRPIIEAVSEDIKSGNSLANALSKHKNVFSDLYISMVKAGETGGILDTVLEGLSLYLEKTHEFKNNLISSLIYPCLLLIVSILSIFILIIFVVPKFINMFETMNVSPPLPILFTAFIGNFFKRFWWIFFILIVISIYLFKYYTKKPKGKLWIEEKSLTLPFIGQIILKVENARFARTLGVLLKNGVPILKSIMITKEIIVNQILKKEIELIYIGIREGDKLATLLSRHKKYWHAALLSLASIGEETGTLPEMLSKCADILERDVEENLKKIVSLAEPMTIIIMGLIVGSLIISMLTAIFSINETVF